MEIGSLNTPNCQFFTTFCRLIGLCRSTSDNPLLLLWTFRYRQSLGKNLPVSNLASTCRARLPKQPGMVEGDRTEPVCTAPALASERVSRVTRHTSGGSWKSTPRNVNACFACTHPSGGGWCGRFFPPDGFPCWRQKSTWRRHWPKSAPVIDLATCKA